MPKSSIIQYDMCIKCKVNIAKLGLYYCFYCKPRDKESQNCKIYFYKFKNKHSKSRLLLRNEVYHKEPSLCIEPVDFGSHPPLSNNQLFSMPTWEQFRSFTEFTNFVIKSDRISFSYFIVSCTPLIQNIPKFQRFIESRSIELPPICSPPNFLLPAPMSKPLQVLSQSSFWNDLLKFYFQELHPIAPLFSIKSFNPKTASPYLMSAIYYGAYCFGTEQPEEIADYMEKFAEHCIKKIVRSISIDNVRALVIFTQLYQWNGEYTLAKTLQGHMSRMSYALGLHLDCKKLSAIERYNRQLLFSAVKIVNASISGSHGFAPNYLTESCNSNLSLIDSKWQLPDPSCIINFDSNIENIVYSLSITEFYNYSDKLNYIIWFPNFMKLSISSFNQIWNKKLSSLKSLFETTVNSFNQMKEKYIEMEASIADHICKAKMLYHDASLELYELFKHKHETLSRRNISTILDHCHGLFETVVECSNYNPYYQYYAHILGLHYLNVYSKCNPAQKIITKQRLRDLLVYMKSKYFSYYSLNYLLLKTGYDSIEE